LRESNHRKGREGEKERTKATVLYSGPNLLIDKDELRW
jgi:hypothetical protein